MNLLPLAFILVLIILICSFNKCSTEHLSEEIDEALEALKKTTLSSLSTEELSKIFDDSDKFKGKMTVATIKSGISYGINNLNDETALKGDAFNTACINICNVADVTICPSVIYSKDSKYCTLITGDISPGDVNILRQYWSGMIYHPDMSVF